MEKRSPSLGRDAQYEVRVRGRGRGRGRVRVRVKVTSSVRGRVQVRVRVQGLLTLLVEEGGPEGDAAWRGGGGDDEAGELGHDEAVLLGEGEQQVHRVLLVEDAWSGWRLG